MGMVTTNRVIKVKRDYHVRYSAQIKYLSLSKSTTKLCYYYSKPFKNLSVTDFCEDRSIRQGY